MKYLKSDFMTKLIIFALTLAITASLCACNEESEQSSESIEEPSEESFVLPDFSQEELPEDDGILSVDEFAFNRKAFIFGRYIPVGT